MGRSDWCGLVKKGRPFLPVSAAFMRSVWWAAHPNSNTFSVLPPLDSHTGFVRARERTFRCFGRKGDNTVQVLEEDLAEGDWRFRLKWLEMSG